MIGETKICTKCLIEKNTSEFGVLQGKYLNSWCKECKREYARKHMNEINNSCSEIREKNKASCRKYYYNNKIREVKKVRDYYRASPEKMYAHDLVKINIRNGNLQRADSCECCSRVDLQIYAHHPDYKKPNEIIWLCRSCHKKVHNGIPLLDISHLKVTKF